jgi:hypothetical protein
MKLIRRFKISIVLILLVSFLLPSCAKTNKEGLPVFPIPESDLNSEIVITKLDGINSYKYGDFLRFGVTNISDHNINMGKYYSLIIYVKHEGEWLEVKDGTNIHSYSDIILGYGKDVSRLGGRSANPIIPFESKSYDILVYVAGDMIEENGIAIKKVGAYRIFQLRVK